MYIQCMVGFLVTDTRWDGISILSSSDARARSNESDARHVSRARSRTRDRRYLQRWNHQSHLSRERRRRRRRRVRAPRHLVGRRDARVRVSRRDRATRDPSDARRPGAVRDFSRDVRSRVRGVARWVGARRVFTKRDDDDARRARRRTGGDDRARRGWDGIRGDVWMG